MKTDYFVSIAAVLLLIAIISLFISLAYHGAIFVTAGAIGAFVILALFASPNTED